MSTDGPVARPLDGAGARRRSSARDLMRVRGSLLLACLLTAACGPSDTGILFVGDSLTSFPIECDYPALLQRRHPPGRVRSYNIAAFGTDAQWWLREGRATERLASYPVDVVVIALGTNDARGTRTPEGIVDDILELRRRVEAASDVRGRHPTVYVATIPPMYDPPDLSPEGRRGPPGPAAPLRARIAAANELLRARVPASRRIDFDSWMPAEWDARVMGLRWDGIHVGCGGQALRAEAVERGLGIR